MASSIFVIILLACVVDASRAERNETGGENYIIGGRTARPHQFPFMAALRTTANRNFCAGVILNQRWVLSAAHCMLGPQSIAANVVFSVGAHTRHDGFRHLVEAIVNHPAYNRRYSLNDVSVIRSARNIEMVQGRVAPIRLPQPNRPENHEEPVWVAGWGLTAYPNKRTPRYLQYKQTVTISNNNCRSLMPPNRGPMLQNQKLCTLSPVGQGICRGDSGSPLVDRQGVLIGVSSWIIPCGRQFPDVYSRVTSFIPWIQQHTGAQPQ